jgi:heptosyltransferase-1
MDKILLVKTSSLGDLIHIYPVVQYLRSKFPKATIDWVVEEPFKDLVKAHPFIDRTITVATKAWRKAPFTKATRQAIKAMLRQLREVEYDLVIDLQGNFKSGLITGLARSPLKIGFGWQSVAEKPNLVFTNKRYNPEEVKGSVLNIRQDYLSIVAQHFNDKSISPAVFEGINLSISREDEERLEQLLREPCLQNKIKVMVCPGSIWPNKQLTHDDLLSYLQLVREKNNCAFLFIFGSKEERQLAESLQQYFSECSLIVEKMSLSMLQNLMGRCDLVIAMDSLPLHLAGTTKTATFSFFGPSRADKYRPLGEQHKVFQGSFPYGRTFVKRCPILRTCPTGACLHNIKIQKII